MKEASAQLVKVEARVAAWGLKDVERRELYVQLARALKVKTCCG